MVKTGIIPLENGASYSRIVSDAKDNSDLSGGQSITKGYQGNRRKPSLKAYVYVYGKYVCLQDGMEKYLLLQQLSSNKYKLGVKQNCGVAWQ